MDFFSLLQGLRRHLLIVLGAEFSLLHRQAAVGSVSMEPSQLPFYMFIFDAKPLGR
jgi:hypothetical protein